MATIKLGRQFAFPFASRRRFSISLIILLLSQGRLQRIPRIPQRNALHVKVTTRVETAECFAWHCDLCAGSLTRRDRVATYLASNARADATS